jgi:hypothetical protein
MLRGLGYSAADLTMTLASGQDLAVAWFWEWRNTTEGALLKVLSTALTVTAAIVVWASMNKRSQTGETL